MELFRYTTSKKFMYFGKRKCMVESCVPSCKRQLFSFEREPIIDDVTSQPQESLTSSQNKDWVTCLKSNLEIDCTVSMNKFQLYLEVLNESIGTLETDCESTETLDSDCESFEAFETDHESIETLDSDCESFEAFETDCESIETLDSDCESIEAFETDQESIETLDSDIVWIKDNKNNDFNTNVPYSAQCYELDVLEYSIIDSEHIENHGTVLSDSGFCSDSSSSGFRSGLFGTDVCSDIYFHSNDKIGDVIAEAKYNDVMFCQDENVIKFSEVQWIASPETQTMGMNDFAFENTESFSICDDLMPMSDYYYSGSVSGELFPVDFMEE